MATDPLNPPVARAIDTYDPRLQQAALVAGTYGASVEIVPVRNPALRSRGPRLSLLSQILSAWREELRRA